MHLQNFQQNRAIQSSVIASQRLKIWVPSAVLMRFALR